MKINILGIRKELEFFPKLQVKVSEETARSYRFDCTVNLLQAYNLDKLVKCVSNDSVWYYGTIAAWDFTLTKDTIHLINSEDETQIKFKISNDRLIEWLEDSFYTKYETSEFSKYVESLSFLIALYDVGIEYKEAVDGLLDNIEELYEEYENKKARTE